MNANVYSTLMFILFTTARIYFISECKVGLTIGVCHRHLIYFTNMPNVIRLPIAEIGVGV